MPSNYTIYALVDPRDDTIFYIGRTVLKPSTRLRQHIEEEGCTPKNKRIKDVENASLTPSVVVLEDGITSKKRAFTREVFWIEFFSSVGAKLTNASIDYDGKYFFADYCLSTISKESWTTELNDLDNKHNDIKKYISKRPINHGKPWTSTDQELLEELYEKGKTVYEIADLIGRTIDSTNMRLGPYLASKYPLKNAENELCHEQDNYNTNHGDEQMLAHKSGTRWTTSDDEGLKYMLEEGKTISYIAKALGRSEGGVKSRIFRIRDEI